MEDVLGSLPPPSGISFSMFSSDFLQYESLQPCKLILEFMALLLICCRVLTFHCKKIEVLELAGCSALTDSAITLLIERLGSSLLLLDLLACSKLTSAVMQSIYLHVLVSLFPSMLSDSIMISFHVHIAFFHRIYEILFHDLIIMIFGVVWLEPGLIVSLLWCEHYITG